MRVLFVRGNPRKRGATEQLANLFLSGLKKGGAEVFDFDTTTANISDCSGCFACTAGGIPQTSCVKNDDMRICLDYLNTADALVCVSPVYFYMMSAQLKRFFDRSFPFIRGCELDNNTHKMVNKTAYAVKPKKFVSISTALGRLEDSFEAIDVAYRAICTGEGFEYCANIRRGEIAHFGESAKSSGVRMKKILAGFESAGEEFARVGAISKETIDVCELPLCPSGELFIKNAQIYWQIKGTD